MRAWVAPLLCALFITAFSAGLITLSQDGHPMSTVDEHIHFDTAALATQGEIPWRGAVLSQALIDEWACGVGHEAGALPYPCGDPRLTADIVPSGKYTSGYIHYPTYFFAAAAFQPVWQSLTGNDDLIDGFRAFSAFTLIAGVIACTILAWLLRVRGPGLVAATTLPIAGSMLVFAATIVNPTSTSLFCGALIVGTTLLWIRRNRGFVWVALAVAFSASIAVTSSLPAGGTLIAIAVVLMAQPLGLRLQWRWTPKWWHLLVLAALLLAPIVIWGRIINARATVPNKALYDFSAPSSASDVILGAIRELTSLHTPWRETGGIYAKPEGAFPRILQAISAGTPTWITVLVFGVVVIAAIVHFSRTFRGKVDKAGDQPTGPGAAGVSPYALLAAGTIVTIVLYPPALRISNWLNFGVDFPIVDRYSNAFAPVLILAMLVWLANRPTAPLVVAASIGGLTALGTVAAGF